MIIGVIGAGKMGRNHIRIYSELKGVDELLIYDKNPKILNFIEKTIQVTCTMTCSELLEKADAVSICTPTSTHHAVANEVLKKNVPMLIEKPLCLTPMQGLDLVQSLPEKLVVGVGHIERFNPVIGVIKPLIENPRYIAIHRHNPTSTRISDATVVEDLMIHDIDIVYHGLGLEIPCVDATNFTEDVCSALLRTSKGCPVYLSASKAAAKKIRTIYIEDGGYSIEGDLMDQKVIIYSKADRFQLENQKYMQENVIEQVLVNKVEPLRVELATFIDCVKKGIPFPVTPRQALKNLTMCSAIRSAGETE